VIGLMNERRRGIYLVDRLCEAMYSVASEEQFK
jgi:hypothetical protein